MPIVRSRAGFLGLGQACQYKITGQVPDPSIPICGPGGYQMTAAQIASVQAAQAAGGYSDTTAPGSYTGAFSSGPVPVQLAPYAGGAYNGPAQSNAPNAVSTPVPSAPVQSNGPNQVVNPVVFWPTLFGTATSPVAAPAAVGTPCFSLFQGESCIGPIGSMTLLAVGGGILGLLLVFGGHR